MTDQSEVQPEEVPAAPVETPESQPEAPAEPETDEGTEEAPETEEQPAEDAAGLEVVNDGNGQHVNMPDGSTVYTRSHPYPVTNTEWENYELTHSGDQLRYSLKPGDEGYSALSDPSVPNSHLAQQVTVQLASFAERVKDDPEARPSVTWDALQPGWQGALEAHAETGVSSGKIVE